MRVPSRYASVEAKSEIVRSLKTDSEKEALARKHAVETQIIAELDARLAGVTAPGSFDHYRVLAELAAARGFTYKSAEEISSGNLGELLARVAAVSASGGDQTIAKAVLGGTGKPKLMLSELVEHVEANSKKANQYKNDEQMRIWRTARKRAVENLIQALGGDKPVLDLTREDAVRHKVWWRRRVDDLEVKAETPNKDFSNMAGLLAVFFDTIEVADPPKLYAGIRFAMDKTEEEATKLPIPTEWIQTKILAPGALDGTKNPELADLIRILAETGCRQSEVANLPASAIILDAELPGFRIDYEGAVGTADEIDRSSVREIKNKHSKRFVPLVGIALDAMRRNPEGFPKYRNNSNFSADANSYLRENNLLPGPEYTVGGLRHSFEDRMERVGVPTDVRGFMLGHSVRRIRKREFYGSKTAIERRHAIAEMIRFILPGHERSEGELERVRQQFADAVRSVEADIAKLVNDQNT